MSLEIAAVSPQDLETAFQALVTELVAQKSVSTVDALDFFAVVEVVKRAVSHDSASYVASVAMRAFTLFLTLGDFSGGKLDPERFCRIAGLVSWTACNALIERVDTVPPRLRFVGESVQTEIINAFNDH